MHGLLMKHFVSNDLILVYESKDESDNNGIISLPFWDYVGILSESLWDYSGIAFESTRTHVEIAFRAML